MRALRHKCSSFGGRVGFWTGIGGLCLVASFGSGLTGQGPGTGPGTGLKPGTVLETGLGTGQQIGNPNQAGMPRAGLSAGGINPSGANPPSPTPTAPPQIAQMLAADGVLGFASPDGSGGQMVTLVHASRQWMTVYAISSEGEIRLRSSRPLDQDFSVQYNLTEPTPEAIKRLNIQP